VGIGTNEFVGEVRPLRELRESKGQAVEVESLSLSLSLGAVPGVILSLSLDVVIPSLDTTAETLSHTTTDTMSLGTTADTTADTLSLDHGTPSEIPLGSKRLDLVSTTWEDEWIQWADGEVDGGGIDECDEGEEEESGFGKHDGRDWFD